MLIVAIDGGIATIAADGLEQRASLMLVPEAQVGEYVLVHAGFALSVLAADEAAETLALLAELTRPEDEEVAADERQRES
jgi:hydrogenase expression/formation protein HypC